MNLLSSNERLATGGPVMHSSIGVPRAPSPLKRSSVREFRSVVGASCMVWLSTVDLEAVESASATTKAITTDSFKIFIPVSPLATRGRWKSPREGRCVGARARVSVRRALMQSPLGKPWKEVPSPRVCEAAEERRGVARRPRSVEFPKRYAKPAGGSKRGRVLSSVQGETPERRRHFGRSRRPRKNSAGAKKV